jgi:hypothetical protein
MLINACRCPACQQYSISVRPSLLKAARLQKKNALPEGRAGLISNRKYQCSFHDFI